MQMNKTKIDWCDSTWNPVTGCLHGCEYCYARGIAKRFDGKKVIKHGARTVLHEPVYINAYASPYPYGFTPTFHRYRLNEYLNKKGKNIFVCSMADLFGDWVPDSWIEEVFAACEAAPQHNYLFLTKNPSRYQELCRLGKLPELRNMWYGSTMTGPEMMGFQSRKHNTFWSIEPILYPFGRMATFDYQAVNWIVVGAETGRRKGKVVPERQWIEDIAEGCKRNDVPIFMKSSLADIWGEPLIQEFPELLRKRCGNA